MGDKLWPHCTSLIPSDRFICKIILAMPPVDGKDSL